MLLFTFDKTIIEVCVEEQIERESSMAMGGTDDLQTVYSLGAEIPAQQPLESYETIVVGEGVRVGLERARARRALRLQGLSEELVDGPSGEEAQKIVENLQLAKSVANGFIRRRNLGNLINPDIQQVAQVGLLKAVRGFDESKGVAFTTYAVHTVSGTVKNYLKDQGWTVRPPKRLNELRVTVETLANGSETKEDIARISTKLGVTVQQVQEALNLGKSRVVQLEEGLDSHAVTRYSSGEDVGYKHSEVHDLVAQALQQDSRRIEIFMMYMNGYKNVEIIEATGLTNGQVSRILVDARTKLKEHFADLQC